MIPVLLQPEPPNFDIRVRKRGMEWLASNNIGPHSAPPEPSLLPQYWQEVSRELWDAYSGCCAYLAVYFRFPTGAHSTDHFIAKSKLAGQAYEWGNYRLSCLGANRRKNKFDDVLDPFTIEPETFHLNLSDGTMILNPAKASTLAQATLDRLGLNDFHCKEMRAKDYDDYIKGDISATHLKRHSPFVHYEAQRQGLL